MKRVIVIVLLVALALVAALLLSRCEHDQSPPPVADGDCYDRAEQMVAALEEGRPRRSNDRTTLPG